MKKAKAATSVRLGQQMGSFFLLFTVSGKARPRADKAPSTAAAGEAGES